MKDDIYGQLIEKVSGRFSQSGVPMIVQLEITKRCALDCVHCYVDHRRRGSELGREEIFGLMDELADLGVLMLTLTGGEPLLRDDLWDILEHGRRRNFFLRLFTSGVLLDSKDVLRIHEYGVGEVHISVYSHRAEIHDRITGMPGSWRKSIDAIRGLREAGVTVWLKSVVMSVNAGSLRRLVDLAGELDCSYEFDTNLTPAENQVRDPLKLRLSGDELIQFLADPANAALIFRDGNIKEAFAALSNEQLSGKLCNIGQITALVDAFGNVQPCAVYPPIGNIRDCSFSWIWKESPEIKRLRELTYETQIQCPSCPHVQYCSPCVGFAKIEQGDERACNSGSRIHAIAIAAMDELSKSDPESPAAVEEQSDE